MTARRLGLCGGVVALAVGMVCLDLMPPLGVLETGAAIAVLVVRRPVVFLVALVPTGLIVADAARIMLQVSGPANPVMWPIVIGCLLIAAILLQAAAAT